MAAVYMILRIVLGIQVVVNNNDKNTNLLTNTNLRKIRLFFETILSPSIKMQEGASIDFLTLLLFIKK